MKFLRTVKTPQEKILAVQNYFHQNYKYEIGIKVPPGEDALTWFLLEQPNAHCEFFASGAALLLRLSNVPCRYVTGFVPGEYNPVGGYWIARYRDAHAWVEAWIPEKGWVTVEATVAEGVPGNEAPAKSYLWDTISLKFLQFQNWFSTLALDKKFSALLDSTFSGFRFLLTTLPGIILLFLLIGIIGAIYSATKKRGAVRNRNPVIEKMQRLLQRMDQKLENSGLKRSASETLICFAERIEQSELKNALAAAEWYRFYSHTRYAKHPDKESIQQLKSKIK